MLRDLDVTVVRSNQFLCHYEDFAEWADGRKSFKMEDFYRWQRTRLGYLMDPDGWEEPVGGRWNFDDENREPPPKGDAEPVGRSADLAARRPRPGGHRRSRSCCRPSTVVSCGVPNPMARGRRHGGRAQPAPALRRRRAPAVRPTRGRDGRTVMAPGPLGALAVHEHRSAAARRSVRRRAGRVRPRRRPDQLGRRLHPPGDRLARVRVGRLLAVDARVSIRERTRRRPADPAGVHRRCGDRDELRGATASPRSTTRPTTTTSSG